MTKLKVYSGKVNRRKVLPVKQDDVDAGKWTDFSGNPVDTQHMMISLLLPPAVKEFLRQLDDEVKTLCGSRYEHGRPCKRWGKQAGSIVLANQKIRLDKARVRDLETGQEVGLKTYETFQNPELFDAQVFADGLRNVSQRKFEEGLPKIASSFGFTKSSVSRRWIKASAKKLTELNERDLSKLDLVAVIIDGKRFRDRGVVIALGVGVDGKKTVLGIYESDTENSAACKALLVSLEKRGLPERELLFVVDGGSGLNKALEDRYSVHLEGKRRAVRIRCYFHKWKNIEQCLPEEAKGKASNMFWAMRDATRLDVAKNCAESLENILGEANQSALKSFREAKDDLLNVQRLRLSPGLAKFFSTTNGIESLNSYTEEGLRRVKVWKNSNHFQRWLASSCLAAEKTMHRVRGHQNLPALKAMLSKLCAKEVDDDEVIDKMAMTGT